MSRPQTEAEYLARLVPASVTGARLGRRSVLKGAVGAGAALGLPALLAACGGGDDGSASTESASGTVTFGSNQSDPVPKKAIADVVSGFQTANSGITVKINTVDHNSFQENINTYLQGKPDDVFAWFAGYRMRFFAAKGLVGDVSDVWSDLSGFTDAMKAASTGDDGKQYSCRSRTTRGRSSTGSRCGRSTATRSRRRSTS
jgi:multiple sugar transport system substrate-binding protein